MIIIQLDYAAPHHTLSLSHYVYLNRFNHFNSAGLTLAA